MSRLYASENPVIEGLRGLAAMLVVATHYAHLITDQAGAWGFASTGVDLFIVLSGFVFAPYMLGKPLYYPAHLVRRLLRLYPLYLGPFPQPYRDGAYPAKPRNRLLL